MDKRKRIMNFHEEVTHTILHKVVEENNARIFTKVRIADVLDITNSGLSKEEFSYAFKAHFDFVVADMK